MDAPIYWWEMVFFVLIGVGGGVLGGLWDLAWNAVSPLRAKRPAGRVAEALAVSALTSAVVFYLAYAYPQCRSSGAWSCRDADNWVRRRRRLCAMQNGRGAAQNFSALQQLNAFCRSRASCACSPGSGGGAGGGRGSGAPGRRTTGPASGAGPGKRVWCGVKTRTGQKEMDSAELGRRPCSSTAHHRRNQAGLGGGGSPESTRGRAAVGFIWRGTREGTWRSSLAFASLALSLSPPPLPSLPASAFSLLLDGWV